MALEGAELSRDELARLHEAFAQVPYARLLGLEFVSAGRGAARFRLKAREELTRMGGLLHGGAIASLLDTAAAFAVQTLLAPEQLTVTVDLTVHYLRPVLGGEIIADARVLREGRRIVIVAVQARDQSGTITATATTTYAKKTKPPPEK